MTMDQLRTELRIATKLYARALGISLDDAAENIRDARLIEEEANQERSERSGADLSAS